MGYYFKNNIISEKTILLYYFKNNIYHRPTRRNIYITRIKKKLPNDNICGAMVGDPDPLPTGSCLYFFSDARDCVTSTRFVRYEDANKRYHEATSAHREPAHCDKAGQSPIEAPSGVYDFYACPCGRFWMIFFVVDP